MPAQLPNHLVLNIFSQGTGSSGQYCGELDNLHRPPTSKEFAKSDTIYKVARCLQTTQIQKVWLNYGVGSPAHVHDAKLATFKKPLTWRDQLLRLLNFPLWLARGLFRLITAPFEKIGVAATGIGCQHLIDLTSLYIINELCAHLSRHDEATCTINLAGFSRGAVVSSAITRLLAQLSQDEQKFVAFASRHNANLSPLATTYLAQHSQRERLRHYLASQAQGGGSKINLYLDDPVAGFGNKHRPLFREVPVVDTVVLHYTTVERRTGFEPQSPERHQSGYQRLLVRTNPDKTQVFLLTTPALHSDGQKPEPNQFQRIAVSNTSRFFLGVGGSQCYPEYLKQIWPGDFPQSQTADKQAIVSLYAPFQDEANYQTFLHRHNDILSTLYGGTDSPVGRGIAKAVAAIPCYQRDVNGLNLQEKLVANKYDAVCDNDEVNTERRQARETFKTKFEHYRRQRLNRNWLYRFSPGQHQRLAQISQIETALEELESNSNATQFAEQLVVIRTAIEAEVVFYCSSQLRTLIGDYLRDSGHCYKIRPLAIAEANFFSQTGLSGLPDTVCADLRSSMTIEQQRMSNYQTWHANLKQSLAPEEWFETRGERAWWRASIYDGLIQLCHTERATPSHHALTTTGRDLRQRFLDPAPLVGETKLTTSDQTLVRCLMLITWLQQATVLSDPRVNNDHDCLLSATLLANYQSHHDHDNQISYQGETSIAGDLLLLQRSELQSLMRTIQLKKNGSRFHVQHHSVQLNQEQTNMLQSACKPLVAGAENDDVAAAVLADALIYHSSQLANRHYYQLLWEHWRQAKHITLSVLASGGLSWLALSAMPVVTPAISVASLLLIGVTCYTLLELINPTERVIDTKPQPQPAMLQLRPAAGTESPIPAVLATAATLPSPVNPAHAAAKPHHSPPSAPPSPH